MKSRSFTYKIFPSGNMVSEIFQLLNGLRKQLRGIKRRSCKIQKQLVNLSVYNNKINYQATKITLQSKCIESQAKLVSTVAEIVIEKEGFQMHNKYMTRLCQEAISISEHSKNICRITKGVRVQVKLIATVADNICEQLLRISIQTNILLGQVTTVSHQVMVVGLQLAHLGDRFLLVKERKIKKVSIL